LKCDYQLAIGSIGVTEGIRAIQLAIQAHLTHLQVCETQLEQVTQAKTARLHSLPEAPYLISSPCLKPTSAALFLAEVGDPQPYQKAAQWVKFAGIQPTPNASSKKQRSRTPMSHPGRPRLRTLLYLCCLRRVQYDPHFAQLYSRLQRRPDNPLTKMQALGVLMNKLLHIWWAPIHNQTFYDPFFGQSICGRPLAIPRQLNRSLWRIDTVWLPGDTVQSLEALSDLVVKLDCIYRLVKSDKVC
jgi:transposase